MESTELRELKEFIFLKALKVLSLFRLQELLKKTLEELQRMGLLAGLGFTKEAFFFLKKKIWSNE